jgi:hypothetical protein
MLRASHIYLVLLFYTQNLTYAYSETPTPVICWLHKTKQPTLEVTPIKSQINGGTIFYRGRKLFNLVSLPGPFGDSHGWPSLPPSTPLPTLQSPNHTTRQPPNHSPHFAPLPNHPHPPPCHLHAPRQPPLTHSPAIPGLPPWGDYKGHLSNWLTL